MRDVKFERVKIEFSSRNSTRILSYPCGNTCNTCNIVNNDNEKKGS